MLTSKFKFPHSVDDQPRFRTGVVLDMNPASFTADVQMTGAEVRMAAPILGLYGSPGSNDMTWTQNLRGATVVLVLIDGEYYVLSTVPNAVTASTDGPQSETVPSCQAEKDLQAQREDVAIRSYNVNRPKTLLPGDKFMRADDGAELGLLQGGIVRLKASPLAQFVLGKLKDFAQLIARRIQIYSDFGEIEIFHRDDGKVGLEIKGGANLESETHPSKKMWTTLVYLGHKSGSDNSRVFVETRDSGGVTQTTAMFTNDGYITLEAKTEVQIKAPKVTIQADSEIKLTAPKVRCN